VTVSGGVMCTVISAADATPAGEGAGNVRISVSPVEGFRVANCWQLLAANMLSQGLCASHVD
jgi:hypothetical protein